MRVRVSIHAQKQARVAIHPVLRTSQEISFADSQGAHGTDLHGDEPTRSFADVDSHRARR